MIDTGSPGPAFARPRLVVAAALVDDVAVPRRLLAARRNGPPALAGRWEFPGGKVEADELPEAALEREIFEELGVRIDLGPELSGPQVYGIGTHGVVVGRAWELGVSSSDGSPLVMRLWLATIRSGTPRMLEDHDRLRWLEPGEWRDVAWVKGDLPIVEALIEESVKRNRVGWC